MTEVFADTSFFIALIDSSDGHHQAAKNFVAANTAALVTSNAVILELGAYFSKREVRPLFSRALWSVTAAGIAVIPTSTELLNRGITLFESRPDKNWSLTDSISFVIMTDRHMTDAATTDEHFNQAGFHTLLYSRFMGNV